MNIPANVTRAQLRSALPRIRAEAAKVRARGDEGLAQRLENAAREIEEESDRRPNVAQPVTRG